MGLGRAIAAGGEIAVEISAEVPAVLAVVLVLMRGVEVEDAAVVGAGAVVDRVGRRTGEVVE